MSNTGTDCPLLKDGWTPATDRLPPEGESVIVAATYNSGPLDEKRTVMEAEHLGNGHFHVPKVEWPVSTSPTDGPDASSVYYRVTHWASMPPLPEKIADQPTRGDQGDPNHELERMNPDT